MLSNEDFGTYVQHNNYLLSTYFLCIRHSAKQGDEYKRYKGHEDVISAPKKLVGHINFDGDLEAITKTKIAVA